MVNFVKFKKFRMSLLFPPFAVSPCRTRNYQPLFIGSICGEIIKPGPHFFVKTDFSYF